MMPPKMTMALFAAMVMALGGGTARADPKDYRFEAASSRIAVSSHAPLAVRVIHVPSGQVVSNAILFQPKLEMAMGSAMMPTRITPSVPDGKGLYPFVAEIGMAGSWTLTVSAKVQGETATLTGTVPFTAVASDPAGSMAPGRMTGSMDHGHAP